MVSPRPPSSGSARTERSAPESSRARRVTSASTSRGSEPDSSRVVTSALAWIQRCWRRAASYSRAFSTATPAAAPSATSTASSSSVNSPPPRLPVRYKLPNTSSRTRTGTPRKPCIGGCPSGKPDDAGCEEMSASRSGRGSSMSRPSRPRPSGQWWIRAISSWLRPDRDELGQPQFAAVIVADDAERAVGRVDQADRGLDDPPESGLQVQAGADRHDRLEQAAHPVPGRQHRLQPALQLGEQLVELQVRKQLRAGRGFRHQVLPWTMHR